MNKEGFRQYLQSRQTPEDKLAPYIALAEEFETFARRAGRPNAPDAADVHAFSAALIADKRNSWDNYLALLRYGRFVRNDPVLVAALELLDGAEAMEVLYEKLGQEVGPEVRDQVFQGIALPPLGTPNAERPEITRAVMERLAALVDPAISRKILSNCLRRLDTTWYLPERKKYLESGSFDAYLERKGRDFIAELERIEREGGLYFSQPITPEVIDFVRGHPEIAQGIRVGNVLYEVKIPYMTVEYLAATDERMKRYHYCHCPWAKESLRADQVPVPAAFCQCSAGFTKKSWEVILDQPLEAEIVESVLQGDLWCKIAVHLPAEVVRA